MYFNVNFNKYFNKYLEKNTSHLLHVFHRVFQHIVYLENNTSHLLHVFQNVYFNTYLIVYLENNTSLTLLHDLDHCSLPPLLPGLLLGLSLINQADIKYLHDVFKNASPSPNSGFFNDFRQCLKENIFCGVPLQKA